MNLPKIKAIKIKLHRCFEGKIKTVTISKTPSGKFFASVLVATSICPPKLKPKHIDISGVLGIDLGLTHFGITSQGEKINNPKYLSESLSKLGVEQKIGSRKDYKNKSKNYQKQSIKVARIHEKISARRYGFIQKLTKKLVSESQTTAFAVENLHVKGMIRNKKLPRSISDSAWGTFLRILSYKAD